MQFKFNLPQIAIPETIGCLTGRTIQVAIPHKALKIVRQILIRISFLLTHCPICSGFHPSKQLNMTD